MMHGPIDIRYPSLVSKLMKIEFSGQIFEKHSIANFHGNPSHRSRVVPCGQTDRRITSEPDEANNRFSQFCEKRLKQIS